MPVEGADEPVVQVSQVGSWLLLVVDLEVVDKLVVGLALGEFLQSPGLETQVWDSEENQAKCRFVKVLVAICIDGCFITTIVQGQCYSLQDG